jgi:hypothetical protein
MIFLRTLLVKAPHARFGWVRNPPPKLPIASGFTFDQTDARAFPSARVAAEFMLYEAPSLRLSEIVEKT